MAEQGAPPKVPELQRRILQAVQAFTSPLLPDDYLELINPLWSTRELRGRIESIDRETHEASTVVIKPGYKWPGHLPGQYTRIGIDIDGRRHWRAYSLTSDPARADGCISITVKHVETGVVSPKLVHGSPGSIVSLGGVEGDFTIPDPLPERLLFVSAGSGITPIMSMLRSLGRADQLRDAILIHSAPTPDHVIFGRQLRGLQDKHAGFRVHEQHTRERGRMTPADLDELCPDWRERETFLSGPRELLDATLEHFEAEGLKDNLHMERFQPVLRTDDAEAGEGGTIRFLISEREVENDGTKPILVAGEEAGLDLNFGCREGICHTCVGKLCSGKVRDLRTGKVLAQEGQLVRTCINAPEGPIEISL